MGDVIVGRQPVFDRDLDVIGYELLFRSVPEAMAATTSLDGEAMTAAVLFSAVNIGIERLAGDKLMFCNADRSVLIGDVMINLPPDQTIIEVLETVHPDEEVLAGCRTLIARGYRLALDDFLWFEGAELLLELASVVKIDVQALPWSDLPELVTRLRQYDVQLLAEKVETDEEVATCRELGFDLFQGFALARPRTVSGRTLDSSELGRVRLAATLLGDTLDTRMVEEIIRSEPGLALQLMKLASVGRSGQTGREVRSIREALVLLGDERIRSWLTILVLRSSSRSTDDLVAVLARARTCELTAVHFGPAIASFAFTAGMLSALHSMLHIETGELREMLTLDPELEEAAFGADTPMGRLVRCVAAHQDGEAIAVDANELTEAGVTMPELRLAAAMGLAWAVQTTNSIEPAGVTQATEEQ
ncbi:diguanylate phosphodiesterase [Jatrophihabitans sp. GAS493]|uniref:EAL and HDOD domain-containing protein n=1 Tax=Jatrophihabitans sp. GAS493 TaxID=1907575 RepID=UPI000BB90BD6|nr:EAL domain-containing protein [Jatrophihabitans sp. GAS493]SOD72214.1 diguanylate phosphodiesterase [Jatrophihabitans sp. GAS493]